VQVWGERTGGTKDALALDGEQPLASKVTGMVGEGRRMNKNYQRRGFIVLDWGGGHTLNRSPDNGTATQATILIS
jgi:hypothetical protein